MEFRKVEDQVGCTVNEILLAYIRYIKAEYGGSKTHQYYSARAVAKLTKAAYGNTLASNFGPKRLKEFREQLIRQDYTRQYINDVAKRLKMMFKWAVSEEMIPGEIVVNLATVQGLKRKRTSIRRDPACRRSRLSTITLSSRPLSICRNEWPTWSAYIVYSVADLPSCAR